MRKNIIYIAGPMRTKPRQNFPAFDKAKRFFIKKGFNVISPADLERKYDKNCENLTLDEANKQCKKYAERDSRALLKCTHIAMLPGWRESVGATWEFYHAIFTHLIILDSLTGEPLDISEELKPFTIHRNGKQLTNREKLLEYHKRISKSAYDIMTKKNHDYAGETGHDPFANFRRVEAMNVCSTERGFLVRIIDKLSRLSTFLEAGKLLVENEGVEDSLIDIINYSVLFGAWLEQKKSL